jgi:hypothetical protein
MTTTTTTSLLLQQIHNFQPWELKHTHYYFRQYHFNKFWLLFQQAAEDCYFTRSHIQYYLQQKDNIRWPDRFMRERLEACRYLLTNLDNDYFRIICDDENATGRFKLYNYDYWMEAFKSECRFGLFDYNSTTVWCLNKLYPDHGLCIRRRKLKYKSWYDDDDDDNGALCFPIEEEYLEIFPLLLNIFPTDIAKLILQEYYNPLESMYIDQVIKSYYLYIHTYDISIDNDLTCDRSIQPQFVDYLFYDTNDIDIDNNNNNNIITLYQQE